MKELPWFKFFPNQWLTGSISFQDFCLQGAFIKICCYYWSKECKVSFEQYKTILPQHYKELIDKGMVKHKRNKVAIDWLDEQLKDRKEAHKKRVDAGRKGGKKTSNKVIFTDPTHGNAEELRKILERKRNGNS